MKCSSGSVLPTLFETDGAAAIPSLDAEYFSFRKFINELLALFIDGYTINLII